MSVHVSCFEIGPLGALDLGASGPILEWRQGPYWSGLRAHTGVVSGPILEWPKALTFFKVQFKGYPNTVAAIK